MPETFGSLKIILISENVYLRLHPNEKKGKYDFLISGVPEITETSPTVNLLDELVWADAVIGGESMALVIALLADKKVFSCIPKTAKKQFCLPHSEIIRISSFDDAFKLIMQ